MRCLELAQLQVAGVCIQSTMWLLIVVNCAQSLFSTVKVIQLSGSWLCRSGVAKRFVAGVRVEVTGRCSLLFRLKLSALQLPVAIEAILAGATSGFPLSRFDFHWSCCCVHRHLG